jgi:DNA-binding transcriptional LysR family regulator
MQTLHADSDKRFAEVHHNTNSPRKLCSKRTIFYKRRSNPYCKRCGKFRPKFHGPAQGLAHGLELVANENAVFLLPAYAIHYSPPGVITLPLEDSEVTWKILVIWRRGRAGGALKALLNALFA